MSTLKSFLPTRSAPAPTPDADVCPECKGALVTRQYRPYYIGSRYYGDLDELLPCPVCSAVTCATCGDTGVVRYDLPKDHPQFGTLQPCMNCANGRQMAQNMQQAALREAEVPSAYKGLTFASWDALPYSQRAHKELARAAAALFAVAGAQNFMVSLHAIYAEAGMEPQGEDRECNCLVFQGPVGTGKTGLTAAIANYLLSATKTQVLYSRARDLIGDVQARYGKDDAPSADDVLNGIKKAQLLIVDEFNLAQQSANRQDIMEELMRYRHNHGLPTLITLNADRDAMEDEWGLRTATVVRAMSHWLPVEGAQIRNEGTVIRRGTL